MALLAGVMILAILRYGCSPHVPMLLGCAGASVVALLEGFSWKSVEEGMIQGIDHALSSVILLILIGVLMGVWIQAGVVPSLVYYGLQLITPRFFLLTSMLLCALVSLALGSWGTIGTIGLALIGVAGAYYRIHGFPMAAFFAGILPHGIFELTALVLAAAMGFTICLTVMKKVFRTPGTVPMKELVSDVLRTLLMVALPLLVCAALVEAFITPWFMALFLP